MARSKSLFSGVPRNNKKDATQDALTENIEVLTGQRGDEQNRALLVRDLVNIDEMKRQALIRSTANTTIGGLPVVVGGGIERPHAPAGLTGVGGFTFITLTWNKPNYKGHAFTEIFRADTNDFSAAVRITTEVSDIFSDNVDMGSGYYYWVRFVNQANMIGPTQGASGLLVETSESAATILSELEGKIESSHLDALLTGAIDKIPNIDSSVDQLLLDMPQLLIDVPQLLIDLPQLKLDIENPLGDSVGADLANNYSTTEDAGIATATAINALKAIVEDPAGTSVGATLVNNHYTKADADLAISAAITSLQSALEGSEGSVDAEFLLNYYTIAAADSAISSAVSALKVLIENPLGSSVGADLVNNHYTKVNADLAIAAAITTLKAAIEDPLGSSLGATLTTNHYTKTAADSAISAEIATLKALIEDPDGSSVGADLVLNHYTKVSADLATATAINNLKAIIEDPNGSSIAADLTTNHYTKTAADLAIASAIAILKSNIENPAGDSVGATLVSNYRTEVDSDVAIASAINTLQSLIENPNGSSVGATLSSNYRTETDTNTAISTASNTLQALIEDVNGNSVGASLQTLSQTVANNSNDFTAMWGVKTTVAEVTASFGLVNDGADPIFAIKGAKFAVITAQTPGVLTPVFSVVDGKTVIKSALIDEAHIQSLVTDDLLSNRIVVGSELNTPSINYDKNSGARTGNFSIDPNGNMEAKSATLESVTIKDAQGNVVMSSTGAIDNTQVTGLVPLVQGYADTAEQNAKDYADGEFIDSVQYGTDITELQSQIDGNITTWFLNGAPTLANAPANTWTTTTLKNQHLSDIYYDDATGFAYRFKLVSTTYSWQKIDDSDITKALSDASKAQDTADGKRRVFVAQPIPPYDVGDLWDIGSGFNRCKAAKLANGSYSSSDWQIGATANQSDADAALVAQAKADLAETTAKAYADGIVTDEEARAIADAQNKANAAENNAKAFSKLSGENQTLYTTVGLSTDILPAGSPTAKGFSRTSNSSHYSSISELIPVIRGEVLYLEMWAKQTGNTARAYMGIERYDRNKKPISSNTGCTYAGLANTMLSTSWVKYEGSTTLPTSHTPYNGSDGGEVYYVRVRILFNYNTTGQAYYSSFRLYRRTPLSSISGAGTLAALNSITYDAVTGKPTLGPFAGLTKILSSNVTTYIESGAIGSAQIDQAYIDTLFGNNGTFLGTVYAEQMEGDVYDLLIKDTFTFYGLISKGDVWHTMASVTVAKASFARTIRIQSESRLGVGEYEYAWYRVLKNGVEISNTLAYADIPTILDTVAARASGSDVYTLQGGVSSSSSSSTSSGSASLTIYAGSNTFSIFKQGGALS